jgi:thioesterase domain-containing protein
MFTSGSTGEPKGVGVPHRAVCRLFLAAEYASFGPSEVFLQLSPANFDAATLEIWGALLHGGRLVIPPPGPVTLDELKATIASRGVTTLWLTAALFERAVAERCDALSPLRQMLTGGDVVPPRAAARFLREVPDCRLVNGYGPTECATFACCHIIRLEDSKAASIPIGRPIANTRAYVLNERLEPIPPGVTGDLYLAGDGLARAYLNRPALTGHSFFEADLGGRRERVYRTGDRASFRRDGSLEFRGRSDDQVKVRGYRIEPAAIERAVCLHPAVRQAVLLTEGSPPAGRQLIAYVVPHSRGAVAPHELRDFLRQRLPEYMIPSRIVLVDSFPVSPNGKIDRRALTAQSPADLLAPDEPGGAESSPCSVLRRVWSEVFPGQAFSWDQDFFDDLGGDSLQAVVLIARLFDQLGVNLPLSVLYEARTPRRLASVAARTDAAESWRVLMPLRQGGDRAPLYCVHGLSGDVFPLGRLATFLDSSIACYGLSGLAAPAEGSQSVESLGNLYLGEIQAVQPRGPYSLAGYSAGGVVALHMATQLKALGEEVRHLILIDSEAPSATADRWEWRFLPQTLLDLPWSLRLAWREWAASRRHVRRGGPEVTPNPYLAQAARELPGPSSYVQRRVAFMVRFYQAWATHLPSRYGGLVTLLRAREQPLWSRHDPTAGFGKHAARVAVKHVPGAHLNVLKEPHVRQVARAVSRILVTGT